MPVAQPTAPAFDETKPMLMPDGPLGGVLLAEAQPGARADGVEWRMTFSPSHTAVDAQPRRRHRAARV